MLLCPMWRMSGRALVGMQQRNTKTEKEMSNQKDVRWVQEPNCTTCIHARPFNMEDGLRINHWYCVINDYYVNSRVCCEEYERKQNDQADGQGD